MLRLAPLLLHLGLQGDLVVSSFCLNLPVKHPPQKNAKTSIAWNIVRAQMMAARSVRSTLEQVRLCLGPIRHLLRPSGG